jgi:hypothetical protein
VTADLPGRTPSAREQTLGMSAQGSFASVWRGPRHFRSSRDDLMRTRQRRVHCIPPHVP